MSLIISANYQFNAILFIQSDNETIQKSEPKWSPIIISIITGTKFNSLMHDGTETEVHSEQSHINNTDKMVINGQFKCSAILLHRIQQNF